MLSVKQGGIKYHFSEFLVWLDLGLNPSLPDHWRTFYSLGHWPSFFLKTLKERNVQRLGSATCGVLKGSLTLTGGEYYLFSFLICLQSDDTVISLWCSSPVDCGNVQFPFVTINTRFIQIGVLVSVRVPSMGQIELFNRLQYLKPFNCKQTNNWFQIEILVLDSHAWNHLTVWKEINTTKLNSWY